jgi:chemotaxis protein MotB
VSRRNNADESSAVGGEYAPAFADIMSGFALTMVFLMFFSWVLVIAKIHRMADAVDAATKVTGIRKEIESIIMPGDQEGSGEGFTGGELGPEGTIRLPEDVLFDLNEWEIKPEGQPVLDDLAQRFAGLLDDAKLRPYIEVIMVEGHTDTTGSDAWNWLLSTRRAIAVVQYMQKMVPRLETEYHGYLAVVGYSKYRPKAWDHMQGVSIEEANRTAEDRRQNRRIEFRVILRDRELLDKVRERLVGY